MIYVIILVLDRPHVIIFNICIKYPYHNSVTIW